MDYLPGETVDSFPVIIILILSKSRILFPDGRLFVPYHIMKTFILSIAFLGICFATQAQKDNQYEGLELDKNLNLTKEQVSEIKNLNQGIGKQFAAIGQDRSLSGKEKGEKKRELALKHKQDIMAVLTPDQIVIWDNLYNKGGEGIKNSLTDTLDDRLDALEDNYEKEKKAIEKNKNLSKAEKEEQKDALKAKYKADKDRLKNEKKDIKNSVLLDE